MDLEFPKQIYELHELFPKWTIILRNTNFVLWNASKCLECTNEIRIMELFYFFIKMCKIAQQAEIIKR